MKTNRLTASLTPVLTLTLALAVPAVAKERAPHETAAAGLASVYAGIAETILASKNSESTIVRAILELHHGLALDALDRASAAGGGATELRAAAQHIGDFATEGGAAIEPIRNKLLQGGHHHNTDDTGPAAVYDEGYVLLTKKLRQEALELAKRCAKLAEAGKPDAKEVAAIRDGLTSIASRAIATK